MQLDAFDSFCLFLGKSALALTVFFCLATVGTLFTSWVVRKMLGSGRVEEDSKMIERMVSVLSANEALLKEAKESQKSKEPSK
jgi:hypothetical protein